MQNFNEDAPHDGPQSPDHETSLVQREILEFFEELELKYGLDQRDLPFDVLAALTRHISRNLHPVDTARFCESAAGILSDMATDYAAISTEAKTRCH